MGQIWRRSRLLISELLDELLEAPGRSVPLPVLMDLGCSFENEDGRQRWSERTVRNTIADLESFGAVTVRGKADRRVRLTTLGLAWKAGRVLPSPVEAGELEDAVVDLEEWFS